MAPTAPLTLAAVIAEIESHGRDVSPRFEPVLYAQMMAASTLAQTTVLGRIKTIHFCNTATAAMIACTSWGRYQILGENLYSVCGLSASASVFSFVNSPELQEVAFNAFVQAKEIDFTIEDLIMDSAKRQLFIERYNGPGDVAAYWVLMQNAIKALGGPTIVGEST